MKSYVRNTIDLSCAKLLLTSVIVKLWKVTSTDRSYRQVIKIVGAGRLCWRQYNFPLECPLSLGDSSKHSAVLAEEMTVQLSYKLP